MKFTMSSRKEEASGSRLSLSVVFAWSAPDAGVESLSANKKVASPPQQQQQHDQIPGSGCTGRDWLVLKTPAGTGGGAAWYQLIFLSSFSPDTGGGGWRPTCMLLLRCAQAGNSVRK